MFDWKIIFCSELLLELYSALSNDEYFNVKFELHESAGSQVSGCIWHTHVK